ncbi:hypothetical protein KSF_089170 [Reticulibacter mediterranei]|uniref:Uncharacterized protein n=1 Tax=Reticulibacter mediterranei TaxID=2778369 RepID=A0A8J3IW01_9CHLR|nr:hypothetical protein KSF_089170 [Reticulibacter mediterranei]
MWSFNRKKSREYIERIADILRWCFEKEHAYHLTRPEVAQYVVSVTKELAELLGISLAEWRGESEG